MDIEDVNGWRVMCFRSVSAFGFPSLVVDLLFSELRDEQIFTCDGTDASSFPITKDMICR